MKILMKTWLMLALFVAGNIAHAGHEVRNGGDIIQCGNSAAFKTLDYVMAHHVFRRTFSLAKVETDKSSMRQIGRAIKAKLPELSGSFDEFVAHLDNETDFSKPYVWDSAFFELNDIPDEQVERLPWACQYRHSFVVIQAVIRHETTYPGSTRKFVRFQYDQTTVPALEPLQKSFLWVHEWLWGVSSDAEVVRRVNYYLHSTAFLRHSSAQARRQLLKFGLDTKYAQ